MSFARVSASQSDMKWSSSARARLVAVKFNLDLRVRYSHVPLGAGNENRLPEARGLMLLGQVDGDGEDRSTFFTRVPPRLADRRRIREAGNGFLLPER